jgi:hypothetical protein
VRGSSCVITTSFSANNKHPNILLFRCFIANTSIHSRLLQSILGDTIWFWITKNILWFWRNIFARAFLAVLPSAAVTLTLFAALHLSLWHSLPPSNVLPASALYAGWTSDGGCFGLRAAMFGIHILGLLYLYCGDPFRNLLLAVFSLATV